MVMASDMVSDTEAVRPGSLILSCPVFAHVISSGQESSVCDNCLAAPNVLDNVAPSRLLRCSRCRRSYYCNSLCQRQAWTLHQPECKYLRKIQPKVPPAIVRLLLRLCFKQRHQPDYREPLPDGSSRGLTDLEMHKKEISASVERSEAFSSFLQVIRACVGETFSSETLFENYCRLVINSTEITDMMGNSLGTGLYLGLSALDHACSPNVNVVFSKNQVEVRAMADIQPPVWSKVRLSYLNTVLPRRMRRTRLEEDYYFRCQCELCEAEDDGLCEGCVLCDQCGAPVGFNQDQCDRCGAETKQNSILSETQIFFKHLNNVQMIEAHRLLKKKFHVYDHRMFDFSERVMAACLDEEEFCKFYQIGESLLPAFYKYFSPLSSSLGLHLAKLAKMAIYLDKKEAALTYLREASEIFKVSHGDQSEMMKYMHSVGSTISS